MKRVWLLCGRKCYTGWKLKERQTCSLFGPTKWNHWRRTFKPRRWYSNKSKWVQVNQKLIGTGSSMVLGSPCRSWQGKRAKSFQMMFDPSDVVTCLSRDKVTQESPSSLMFLTFFSSLTFDQVVSTFTYYLDDFATACKVIPFRYLFNIHENIHESSLFCGFQCHNQSNKMCYTLMARQ